MSNKSRMVDFNKERLYEALHMNDIKSVRELCDDANDSLCYGGNYVSRKTIERACQTGKISSRTLDILSRALDCLPEFFTAPDVIIKDIDDIDECIVYMSDGREALVKGLNLHWSYTQGVYKFYADHPDSDGEYVVAEFFASICHGIVKIVEV